MTAKTMDWQPRRVRCWCCERCDSSFALEMHAQALVKLARKRALSGSPVLPDRPAPTAQPCMKLLARPATLTS